MEKRHIALVVFRDDNDHILLNRRADADEEVWGIIGGGIEEGEDPLNAIKREVAEELQYELDEERDQLVFARELVVTHDDRESRVQLFTARFPGFEHIADTDEVAVTDLSLFPAQRAIELPLLPITRVILAETIHLQ